MSYLPARAAELTITEYTIQSQSVSASTLDPITWDATTKRSSSSTQNHSVSGSDITLNGPGSFWLIASPDITRNSATDSFTLHFYQGDVVMPDQSPISFLNSGQKTYNLLGFTAVNLPYGGEIVITLKSDLVGGQSFTANTAFTLQIWETT